MMEDYLEKTIEFYDKTAKIYADTVKNFTLPNELNSFMKYLPPSPKILDIGCGPGIVTKILCDKGCDVVGIDLSEELLKIARGKFPQSIFYNMDMRELNFDSDSFDGIWNVASLLHLKREAVPKALKEEKRVLKPKGILFLSVKQGDGEGFEEDKRYDSELKWYTYFKQTEINNFLENTGFIVLENYLVKYKDKYRAAHPWMNVFAQK